MLRPIGTLLLTMRLFLGGSKQLEFCRATLTAKGIPMETQSRRRRFVETVSASSESCPISSGTSLWRAPTTGRGTSKGEMLAEDLFFDIEADFFGE